MSDQNDPYQRLTTLNRDEIEAVYIGGVVCYESKQPIMKR